MKKTFLYEILLRKPPLLHIKNKASQCQGEPCYRGAFTLLSPEIPGSTHDQSPQFAVKVVVIILYNTNNINLN